MTLPDFTNLPLESVFALLVAFAAADLAFSVVIAVVAGNFELPHLLDYLRTHVLVRVFPIFALGVFGHGSELLSLPVIPAAGLAATVSLALYGLEVLGSIRDSFVDKSVVPKPNTLTGLAPH